MRLAAWTSNEGLLTKAMSYSKSFKQPNQLNTGCSVLIASIRLIKLLRPNTGSTSCSTTMKEGLCNLLRIVVTASICPIALIRSPAYVVVAPKPLCNSFRQHITLGTTVKLCLPADFYGLVPVSSSLFGNSALFCDRVYVEFVVIFVFIRRRLLVFDHGHAS